MAASPSELSLECKPLPQSHSSLSTLLKPKFVAATTAHHHHHHDTNNSTSKNNHPHQQELTAMDCHSSSTTTQKLEGYLSQLEEERLKIDAFKRELPLCMQLLSNAMEVSRQQLQSSRSSSSASIIGEKPRPPVLEEFIPINKHSSNTEDNDDMTTCSDQNKPTPDKSNWMISAQLWGNTKQQQQEHESSSVENHDQIGPRLTLLDVNIQRNSNNNGDETGRAFHPFSKDQHHQNSVANHHRHTSSLPNLALAPNGGDDKKLCLGSENGHKVSSNDVGGFQLVGKVEDSQTTTTSANAAGTTTTSNGQTQRKQRRCWSPDLHRRFINALQMLGGSQVATPKQIRELMKVDGLTNDEVKSHLQKYRLHTRRPGPISPQASGAQAPQLVVLGGIWVPPEYAAQHHGHGGPTTIYSTHPTSQVVSPQPSHYTCSPQEFYHHQTAGPQPPQTLIHHPQQLQIHHHHPTALNHQIHQLHSAYNTRPPPPTPPLTRHPAQSSPETEERGVSRERSVSTEEEGCRSDSSNWKNGGGVVESGGEERDNINLRRVMSYSLRKVDDEESNGSEITLKF